MATDEIAPGELDRILPRPHLGDPDFLPQGCPGSPRRYHDLAVREAPEPQQGCVLPKTTAVLKGIADKREKARRGQRIPPQQWLLRRRSKVRCPPARIRELARSVSAAF